MRKNIIILISLLFLVSTAYAVEIVRQKNVPTVITFPIIDTSGNSLSSIGTTDTELDQWSDSAVPDGFADCTEPTEIAATGIYYIALTTAEMNSDYIIIQVLASTTEAYSPAQTVLIRTIVGDPANLAVTDDGGAINVTGGAVDTATSVTNVVSANVTQVGGDAIQDNNDGRLEVNVEEIADAAVDTASAQLGVNVVQIEATDATDQLDSHDGNPPTAATIADAIWDEDIVNAHNTAESAGALLDSPGDWATATGFSTHAASDVWSVATRELTHLVDTTTTVDLATSTIGTVENVPSVNVSSLDAGAITAAAIAADAIGSSEIATGAIGSDELDTDAITAAKIASNAIADDELAADVDTLVNDEVVDALNTDTYSEPGQGAPSATPTIREMLHYLYKYWRNKIVTSANTIELYNDAGDTVDQKSAISDDGSDFTRGEMATGP